jgi:SAM-dependent methyltransferase
MQPRLRLDPRLRLVLLSGLMLFVELALIRWLGSNVVYLSYFSNFVLLGSFLGIGIGFLRGRARIDTFRYAPIVLAILIGFVLIFPVQIDRSGSDIIYFGTFTPSGLPTWVTLPVIFLAVAAVMAMIGEGVARQFVEFEPLEAYRLDIGGSLLGIGAFSVLSFLWAPPVAWGAVAAILFGVLDAGDAHSRRIGWRAVQVVALVALALMLGRESVTQSVSWSPYYKVDTTPNPAGRGNYQIDVNGIPHQAMQSVAARRKTTPVYFLPYERASKVPLDDVLIVGAGSGSDVAIALAQGAKHIDAVEIDPRLYQLGQQLHPDKPYQDPRVSVHINDGRAFLEQTDASYDLILFALPDSLTLVQGQSSLRLESYLFTREAMDSARRHLKPGGAFAMYNYYRESWLLDRYVATLDAAYGHPPCIDTVGSVGHMAVLTIGLQTDTVTCASPPQVAADAPAPALDDDPFPYLRDRGIPGMYLLTIGLILAASLVLVRAIGGPFGAMRSYVDLFFMGAAFLLLETKSVVQFALLFGTTWFVNALVFAGVLLSVLGAIEVTRRFRLPRPTLLYALLLVTVILGWLIPVHALLGLPFGLRLAAAVVVYFTPIFAANLVFAQRFRDVETSNLGFGANLLGAMVGGLLEYLALITGYQALALLVAVLYVLALLCTPRARTAVA